MSFITSVRAFFENIVPVPHDAMYREAKKVVDAYDANGDRVVNLEDPVEQARLGPWLLSGLRLADSNFGNGNGLVSTREIRKGLRSFDTGGFLGGAGDGALNPGERLKMFFSVGSQQARFGQRLIG